MYLIIYGCEIEKEKKIIKLSVEVGVILWGVC